MSRTLSKILAICAMIAVFPLLIVGTAFAAYYSIDATVGVSVYTNDTSVAQEAYAKIVYGEKTDSNLTITKGHKSKIKLDTVSNGYDFKGWFAGDVDSYLVEKTTGEVEYAFKNSNISVDMTDYEKLLAVYEIKNYETRYSYKANPNDSDDIFKTPETDDGDATVRTYKYGDILPTLNYEGIEYRFIGWKIVGDETEKIYTTATFDFNEPVTLTAVWQAQSKINVNYYISKADESPVNTVEIYENQLYTLVTPEELVSDVIKNGYNYSWQDKDGKVISTVNTTTSIDVYLKTEAITYSASLNFDENEITSFDKENTIQFNAESYDTLLDWFVSENWKMKYSFYEFAGLKFDGVNYTKSEEVQNLVKAIIDNNPKGVETPVSVEASATKYFTTFNVANGISFKSAAIDSSSYLENVYKQGDLPDADAPGTPWKVNSRNISSTSNVYELLLLSGTEGNPIKVYNKNGDEVALSNLVMEINGKKYTVLYDDGMTLNDIIQQIYNKQGLNLTEVFEVTSIVANFDVVVNEIL